MGIVKQLPVRIAAMATALFLGGASPPASERAEWVTLGTAGGPVTRLERAQPANALVIDGNIYLFDTGDGVLRQLAAAKLQVGKVKAVFLSHHHMDHIAGLGPLLVQRWLLGMGQGALPIFGPQGTSHMASELVSAHRPTEQAPIMVGGPPMPALSVTIVAKDVDPPAKPMLVYQDGSVRVTAIEVDHFHLPVQPGAATRPRSLAYRVEARGRSFVFTGDTGPSARLEQLARDADVLITEVVDLKAIEASLRAMGPMPEPQLKGLVAHMEQDHLTPQAIGALAAQAGVKQVVLTHFVPGLDGERDLSGYTTGIAPRFAGSVRIARDLDRF